MQSANVAVFIYSRVHGVRESPSHYGRYPIEQGSISNLNMIDENELFCVEAGSDERLLALESNETIR